MSTQNFVAPVIQERDHNPAGMTGRKMYCGLPHPGDRAFDPRDLVNPERPDVVLNVFGGIGVYDIIQPDGSKVYFCGDCDFRNCHRVQMQPQGKDNEEGN